MDERLTPQGKASPQDLSKKLADASQLKLYLQQEANSTSFIFKAENGNRIRVSIGSELSCSCDPRLKNHCLHTLYVLLKIFKLGPTDRRIWQSSYSDSEIEEFLKIRNSGKSGQKFKRADRIHKRTSSLPSTRDAVVCRKILNDKDICLLCQETMKESEGITYCSTGCGTNFHMKCLFIWAENPHNVGNGIYCPSCKSDSGSRALEKLLQDLEEFKVKEILHKGHKCGACKSYGQKCIKGKLFHCLYCENFDLCEKCFLSFEHFEHTKYIVKETVNGCWKPAQSREIMYQHLSPARKNIMENKQQKIPIFGGIDQRVALLNMNLAGFEDQCEDKIMSDRFCIEKEQSLEEFIVSCFPEVMEPKVLAIDKESSLNGLLGEVYKKSCSYCLTGNSHRTVRLRRLACGHVVHSNCLLEMIMKRVLKCPEDSSELLRGYSSAFPPAKGGLVNSNVNKLSGEVSPKIFAMRNDHMNNRFTIKGGHQLRQVRGGKNFSIAGTAIAANYSINDPNGSIDSMLLDRVDLQLEQSFQNISFFNSSMRKNRGNSIVGNLPRISELHHEQIKQTMRISMTKRPYISNSQREGSNEMSKRSNMSINTSINMYDLPIVASTIKAVPRISRLPRSINVQKVRKGAY